MNRAGFLKALAVLAVAPRLAVRVVQQISRPHYLHKKYSLGFAISKEMIEDDEMYGRWFDEARMAKRIQEDQMRAMYYIR